MNTPASIVDTIALSLLHFLWQGAAIAAMAGALMLVLRKPATRYLVGVGALALMLLAFGTTIALLSMTARAPAAALASPKVATVTSLSMLWTSQAATSPDAFVWMARAWFAGVFVFALRIVFGLLAIGRLRRGLVPLPSSVAARFEALQARLGIDRVIRYCQCEGVSVPAVIGVFRPVVLLPMRALTGLSTVQLEAVIAHELGHIQRFDVAVNFLQVIAETLLFFHPAVWWLNKRIRAEREDCCDDVAVATCGSRVTYARALAAMEGWRGTPSFAMAATGGTVAARVARLLGVGRDDRGERIPRAVTAMLVLTTALAVGAMSVGIAQPALAQANDSPSPVVAAEPALPALEAVPPAPPVPAVNALPPTPAVPAAPAIPPLEARVAPPAPPLPVAPIPDPPRKAKPPKEPKPAKEPKEPKAAKHPEASSEPDVSSESLVNSESAVEEKVEIEVRERAEADAARQESIEARAAVRTSRDHNREEKEEADLRRRAEADAVRQSRMAAREAAGNRRDHDRNKNVEDEVRRRAEADAARQNRTEGHEGTSNRRNQNRNDDSNVNGTSEHAAPPQDDQANGLQASTRELIALRAQGVSAQYIAQLRAVGIDGDAHQIIALKVEGVLPDYLQSVIAAGVKVDAHEVIAARATETPQVVEYAVGLGLKNLDKLLQLKSADAP